MDRQISQIIEKYKTGTASECEIQHFYALFYQPEAEFDLKNRLIEDLEEIVPDETRLPDLKKVFENICVKIERDHTLQKSKTFSLNLFLRYAAILIIGLLAGFFIKTIFFKAETGYYTARSPKGSVSEIVLPDGSLIFLNSDSGIKYSMDGEGRSREVFLDGEAWFQVEKSKTKLFVVHTPVYDVKVTGTRFNVKAYDSDNEIATTLVDGKVMVSSSKNFKLETEPVLEPGEQFIYNKESSTSCIKQVNTKWITSWKENKLIFVNMKLKELFVVLERKFGVDIEVTNKAILNYHYDGTIKNETILEILEIIKKTLPINYKIVDQKVEITAK